MANLNLPKNRGELKVPIRTGTFTAPNSQTLAVTKSAQVDALLHLGWTRTAD